ncbi:DUF7130 family rubredoxin-like protein [Halococcoides cellulosivorans]|uniref:DUF7130 domain-containing protein n=1 Tax=Halococcoides cellulosivorans TaxID=1679096 RepID=A0A2R4X3Q4_9EURY|nr:hypothetical protein [Halococcoides cellulosivorans]AWB28333.1 hypothetical protein HARCEL1_11755 [Halococcoides cellulosivorans]
MDEHPAIERAIEPGERIYDGDGRLLGHVSGPTEDGFEIAPIDDDAEELPGQEFGEGYLMWRCSECGEMGDIDDGMPDQCPVCDAPREAIEKVRED